MKRYGKQEQTIQELNAKLGKLEDRDITFKAYQEKKQQLKDLQPSKDLQWSVNLQLLRLNLKASVFWKQLWPEAVRHLRRKVDINEADQDYAKASENLLHAAVCFCVDCGGKEEEKGAPARQFSLKHEGIHSNKHWAQLIQFG